MSRILLLSILMIPIASVHAGDLETILRENARAHGGEHSADVRSIRVDLLIEEPTYEVTARYYASRDGRMRIDIYAGDQRVYAEGLNENCAWEWTPDKPEDEWDVCVGETEAATLRHGIEMPGRFYTLEDVRDRGASVELVGETELDEIEAWQVRVTLADGFTRDYFIDQASHQITGQQDRRAFHPGVDPTEITVRTLFFEPEFVDGVLFFLRQESHNLDTGEWLSTTTARDVEHNPKILPEMFSARWVVPTAHDF